MCNMGSNCVTDLIVSHGVTVLMGSHSVAVLMGMVCASQVTLQHRVAGIAQWLKRRTCDRKISHSVTCVSQDFLYDSHAAV